MIAYLADGRKSALTREMYERDIVKFAEWCDELGYEVMEVDPVQFHEYVAHLKRLGHKPATLNREAFVLRTYFEWMVSRGVLAENPASTVRFENRVPVARPVPSVEELRLIWDGCRDDLDRVAVGLLAFCGLRPNELTAAQVADLGRVDGIDVLRLSSRKGATIRPFVAVPAEVADAISRLADKRPTTTLIWRRQSLRPHDRNSLWILTTRLGARVGLPFVLRPLDLSFTFRSLAIEHGFPYAEVVRSVGELDARRLQRWVVNASSSVTDHPALHIARRVFRTDSSVDFMSDAGRLMEMSEFHPAIAAAHAGAALERHLRMLSEAHGVEITGDGKLSAYGARLKGARVLDYRALQLINRIQDIRNDAAHGRFEGVHESDARWVLDNARAIMERHPLP